MNINNLEEWVGQEKQKLIIAKNIIKNISNDDLYKLWQDIKIKNNTNIVSDGCELYKLRENIRNVLCDSDWDKNYSNTIIPAIMEEIAKLHYNER